MKSLMRHSIQMIVHHLTSWQRMMHNHTLIETARNRALVIGGAFFLGFIVIAVRLTEVMVFRDNARPVLDPLALSSQFTTSRADIVDRNGEILATHLVTGSVYANPKVIIDPKDAATKLSALIPELNYDQLYKKLTSDKGFIWLIRHIPPKVQDEVNRLGIPGIYLHRDEKRLYPFGNLVSHVLGYCGIDNMGLAGVEKFFDTRLRENKEPLQLAIDIRIQHLIHDELKAAIDYFHAEGGNVMVMDVKTGEIVAMVSLPDYDPNLPNQNHVEATFNRNTLGIYESGSTFKIYNTAIALETGTAHLGTIYDASRPIPVGRKSITDFKGQNRPLTVKEVFVHSSNIGSAKMALAFGAEAQKQFLGRFGLLNMPTLELPEVGSPLVPRSWSSVTTMTVAYGYGIAVSPLQNLVGVHAVVTGYKKHPTILKCLIPPEEREDINPRVISERTSQTVRHLMRLVVSEGTAKTANVPGYNVFGKTGTAHKNKGRAYNNSRSTFFIGGFPEENPRYLINLVLDDPKPRKETYGYATGGWTAAPTAGKMIARLVTLLGIEQSPQNDVQLNNHMNNRGTSHPIDVNHITHE